MYDACPKRFMTARRVLYIYNNYALTRASCLICCCNCKYFYNYKKCKLLTSSILSFSARSQSIGGSGGNCWDKALCNSLIFSMSTKAPAVNGFDKSNSFFSR